MVFGAALLIMGLWSRQRQSAIALGIAAFIFGADGALGVLLLMSLKVPPNIFMIMVRVGFVLLMAWGAQAAWNLEPDSETEKFKNSY